MPTHEVAFQELSGTDVRVNDFMRSPLFRLVDDLDGRFAHRNRHVEVKFGMLRLDVPDYSDQSFREAVAHDQIQIAGFMSVAMDAASALQASVVQGFRSLHGTAILGRGANPRKGAVDFLSSLVSDTCSQVWRLSLSGLGQTFISGAKAHGKSNLRYRLPTTPHLTALTPSPRGRGSPLSR